MKKVLHKQIYKPTIFGSGEVNTTLCGRVRNLEDYNVAEKDSEITCKFCLRIINAAEQETKTKC